MMNSAAEVLLQDVSPSPCPMFVPRSLIMSIEDQGSSFFFHNFVTSEATPPTSYSVFLPRLYNVSLMQGAIGNPLPDVITAIGMAGISNLQDSPDGMVATRQKHTKALRTLNAALQDPRSATADTTLMAVILMGLFEVSHPPLSKVK